MIKQRPMTTLQIAFADYILQGMDQGKAYKAAGYSVASNDIAMVNASNLIRSAKVVAYIAKAREKTAKRNDIKVDDQLEYTRDLRGRAKNAECFKSELTANDQVSKIVGSYAPDKVEHNHRHAHLVIIQEMDDGELDRLILKLESEKLAGLPE